MIKALMILANGFEDAEAIVTQDILKRSQINVVTATPDRLLNITSQSNVCMQANIYLDQVRSEDYDLLIIPGGKAVFQVLRHSKMLEEVIMQFVNADKWIAAICAAPLLLGRLGFLEFHEYTCFPGCEKEIIGGTLLNEPVVVSGRFITAKAMYYSGDFALKIIELLQGKEQRESILASLKGEK